MAKISEALGFPGMGASEEELPAEDAGETDEGGNQAELLAMKQFGRATTPEAKVEAMKSFLSACGVMDY